MVFVWLPPGADWRVRRVFGRFSKDDGSRISSIKTILGLNENIIIIMMTSFQHGDHEGIGGEFILVKKGSSSRLWNQNQTEPDVKCAKKCKNDTNLFVLLNDDMTK